MLKEITILFTELSTDYNIRKRLADRYLRKENNRKNHEVQNKMKERIIERIEIGNVDENREKTHFRSKIYLIIS